MICIHGTFWNLTAAQDYSWKEKIFYCLSGGIGDRYQPCLSSGSGISCLGYMESLWCPVTFVLQPHSNWRSSASMTQFVCIVDCWVIWMTHFIDDCHSRFIHDTLRTLPEAETILLLSHCIRKGSFIPIYSKEKLLFLFLLFLFPFGKNEKEQFGDSYFIFV